MKEDTDLVNLVMSKSNGATVHAVRNLVGAYRNAVYLSNKADDRAAHWQLQVARLAHALSLVSGGMAPHEAMEIARNLK